MVRQRRCREESERGINLTDRDYCSCHDHLHTVKRNQQKGQKRGKTLKKKLRGTETKAKMKVSETKSGEKTKSRVIIKAIDS